MIKPISKFVGEALEMRDVRTVFSESKEDDTEKSNRIILLIGPSSAEKSDLIDFMCNYFYDVNPNESLRYNIANEKFNSQTPYRPVQCYIFNNTVMDIRPIIIDTPACGEVFEANASQFINKWLIDNWKMRIDVIAFVISDLHRMTSSEEDDIQKVVNHLPEHIHDNIVVFITSSDGSKLYSPLLRRIGLSKCPVFTISTGCVFQKPLDDRLNDEHRRRRWNMSAKQLDSFFVTMRDRSPSTISGLPYIDDALYGACESGSSRSSFYSPSQSTVIEVGIGPTSPPTEHPQPRPPTPPPKPKYGTLSSTLISSIPPPPIPKSPPPPKPTVLPSNDTSFGISLYNSNNNVRASEERQIVSSSTPPPRPPNFSPPKPPTSEKKSTSALTVNSTTHALTNAMIEQLHAASSRNSSTYYEASSEYRYPNVVNVQLRDKEAKDGIASGMGPRRHSVPDDIRHYADETTPPPVCYDLTDRYSTADYMNPDQIQYITRISTHSPTRTNISVRDAYRLSRDDLRIVDKSESSPTNSGEFQRMYSGRSASTVRPTGDVNMSRYVYDTTTRNYTTQGDRQSRSTYVTTDKRRWSKSSDGRSETYITDPYYTGNDVVSGYGVTEIRRSRTSLHSTGPELVHSENKYDYQQLPPKESERFSRSEATRRSRHQSEGSRQIYIDRRISPERRRKDQIHRSYSNIDISANQQYNIPKENNPPPLPAKPNINIHRTNGGDVYEDRSVYEAYSQINRSIGQGAQPNHQQTYPPSYDQVPDQQGANHYIIPKSMRGQGSPIQTIHNQEYGEPIYTRRPLDVTEETVTTTTTTRKEEIEKKRKKKEEEIRRKKLEEEKRAKSNEGKIIYDAYESNRHHNGYGDRDAEQGLLEEEYNSRHFKRTTESDQRGNYDNRGRTNYERQNVGDNNRNTTRKVIEKRESKYGWSPSNYSNPRDCFLNILCFVIAPLVIIAIIVVIIIFVIIQ